jgi:glyoxylase-like metal-dependent hydrolase (beta-lactamase superfamily II)
MSTIRYTPYSIPAGRFALDGGAMFGVVPRPLWSRKAPPDDVGRISLETRCLLLEGGGRLILIDAGIGDKFDAKRRGIYAMEEDRGIVAGIRAHGFEPEDVTDVVLTHLHFDHCGGATAWTGEVSRPVFEGAVHHVQRSHWAWANERNPREKASFLAENMDPLADRLNLLDGVTELFPGIRTEPVNGHTEGQQIVHIDHAGDDHLVFVADLIPTSNHISPVWGMAYDIRPLVTITEKTEFLARAEAGKWRLFFEHDPLVESGIATPGERGVVLEDVLPGAPA